MKSATFRQTQLAATGSAREKMEMFDTVSAVAYRKFLRLYATVPYILDHIIDDAEDKKLFQQVVEQSYRLNEIINKKEAYDDLEMDRMQMLSSQAKDLMGVLQAFAEYYDFDHKVPSDQHMKDDAQVEEDAKTLKSLIGKVTGMLGGDGDDDDVFSKAKSGKSPFFMSSPLPGKPN